MTVNQRTHLNGKIRWGVSREQCYNNNNNNYNENVAEISNDY